MRVPVIPDWCKGMPDHLKLYAEDVMEFYGLKSGRGNAHNIYKEISNGHIPKPLKIKVSGSRSNYWLLGDMRELRIKLLNDELLK